MSDFSRPPSRPPTITDNNNNITTAVISNNQDSKNSIPYTVHSLWMCPSGTIKEVYSSIITDMTSELGTLDFTPHITLVAAILTGVDDVVARAKALALKLAPYEFEYDDLSQKDAYFQSVFAKMKVTQEVVEANALARTFFEERQSDPDYMPHMSLVYGDFDRSRKDETILPELRTKLTNSYHNTTTIPVDAIEVWSTQGDVKEWYLVETVPLTGTRRTTTKAADEN
jgi:2'-5' RNA ligase